MVTTQAASKNSVGRTALLIILASDVIVFVTILAAYVFMRGQVSWYVPHTLTRLAIPLTNTALLIFSALAAWWSNNGISQNRRSALRSGLLVALILGLLFIAGQIYEFNHAGLSIDDQAFGGVFFTLLGFHAVHVLGGAIFLALNLVRANLGDFSAEQHEAVELANWFWYFVTAVWVVLFIALYIA